ncbi:MAG TPA: hypothetical protein VMA36_07355 [Candidatus Limnocylindria bacterium]|jgi:hypothetical protein|nr:hypothetical protein [Candidatus Limnocylindria bacterium]
MAPALGLSVATTIVAAMRRVATADGADVPTGIDRHLIEAAWTQLLGRSEPLDQDGLPVPSADALAAAIPDDTTRRYALRFLVASALHEARFLSRRLAVVREIAAAWSLTVAQIEEMAVRVETRLDAMVADALRPDRVPLGAPPLQPRDGAGTEDAALVARYRALAVRPPHTFGRAFHNLYVTSRFRFPGELGALDETTAVPHDSAHVLAAYATSPRAELLLATFIAAMRGDADVAGFPLTVLAVWHVGLHFGALAETEDHWLTLEPFAAAWERGRDAGVDLFGPEFVFWESIDRDVDELRRATGIRPLPRRGAANGHGIIGPRS